MYEFRPYMKRVVIIAVIAVAVIAAMDFWVDSDHIFSSLRSSRINAPRLAFRDRVAMPERYLAAKCDTLVLGSSRMRYGLVSDDPAWGGDRRVFNMGFEGLVAQELAQVVEWVAGNRSPTTCIIGADRFMFLSRHRARNNNGGSRFDPDLSYPDYYMGGLFGNVEDSWNNFRCAMGWRKREGTWTAEGRKHNLASRLPNREEESAIFLRGADSSLVDYDAFLPLREAISRMRRQGTRVLLVVPPVHISLTYREHRLGEQEDIRRWYREMARMCDELDAADPGQPPIVLWNFIQCGSFEVEPLNVKKATASRPWFYECSHLTQTLGSLMISRMLGRAPAVDLRPDELADYTRFGDTLTMANVDAALDRYEQSYQRWLDANPETAKTYDSFIFKPVTFERP